MLAIACPTGRRRRVGLDEAARRISDMLTEARREMLDPRPRQVMLPGNGAANSV
jgi:hypothetical protein